MRGYDGACISGDKRLLGEQPRGQNSLEGRGALFFFNSLLSPATMGSWDLPSRINLLAPTP